jgi:hypothetical protein
MVVRKRPPVIGHIHVPKCAGTSFRRLLEGHFGSRHLNLYVNDTFYVYSNEALVDFLQDDEVRAFSSHHVLRFPPQVAGRDLHYVTFLRNPIQQVISYIPHVKKYYSAITSESLLQALPPDAPRLSSREFAKWVLAQNRDIPFRENYTVNFFTRHAEGGPGDRLTAAKSVLEGFFFVGIAERMEESIRRLQTLAEEAGLDFPMNSITTENSSNEYRDDLTWICASDEVGSLLLRSVDMDMKLYDWAVRRFDENDQEREIIPAAGA